MVINESFFGSTDDTETHKAAATDTVDEAISLFKEVCINLENNIFEL